MMKISRFSMFTLVCIFCALLACGGVVAAQDPVLHVELDLEEGLCNYYYFCGYYIVDCDGNVYKSDICESGLPMMDYSYNCYNYNHYKFSLSNSGLNLDAQSFKEFKLYFKIQRMWGFFNCHKRIDKVTFDLTDVCSRFRNENEYYCYLAIQHTYQFAKADGMITSDIAGYTIAKLPPTRKTGTYGCWEP